MNWKKSTILGLTLLLFSSATAQAQISFMSGGEAKSIFRFEVDPGESVQDTVFVKNSTDQIVTVDLSAADGTTTNLGSFTVTSNKQEQRTIGTWVDLESDQIVLQPQEARAVDFTVNVPPETTPGDYAGGLTASVSNARPSDEEESTASGVRISTRVVALMFVSVKGEKRTEFDWSDFTHQSGEKPNSFILTLNNTGNTLIKAAVNISLQDNILQSTQELNTVNATLLQGEPTEVVALWKKPPFIGSYTAHAAVTFYEESLITGEQTELETFERSIMVNFLPWEVWVPVLLLLIGGGMMIIFAKHKKKKLRKKLVDYTVQENETLESIAAKLNQRWQFIAKINKMKPPYSLTRGQIIKVLPPKKSTNEQS